MNDLTPLQRKLVFLSAIVVVFLAIYLLQYYYIDGARHEYGLAEETLGEVDETGFTINLVLTGFRGIAANVLWSRVQSMQENHDWEGIRAVTTSITKLQPHFTTVWIYQGWNQAVNISERWDNPRDRYWWITEGIEFLQRGEEQNRTSPELPWYRGWLLFQRIGRSDQSELYRQYWKEDEKTNKKRGQDNFLSAYDAFVEANSKERPNHMMAEVLFKAFPARARIEYASSMMADGTFGEPARDAWREAGRAVEELRRSMDLGRRGQRDRNQRIDCRILRFDWLVDQCRVEIELVPARALFYEGRQAVRAANFPVARRAFSEGLVLWERVFEAIAEAHPDYCNDPAVRGEANRILEQREWVEHQLERAAPPSPPMTSPTGSADPA